jgi:hypothetical protein
MNSVKKKLDIPYYKGDTFTLHMDVYAPPDLKAGENRPAIVFLNAVGDYPGERKVKSWGIYTSWPALMAAHGYIGISMEAKREDIMGSITNLFNYLQAKGSSHQIDTKKLGVYAASANVSRATKYLMSSEAYAGIKAAVLYYGSSPDGPFRKDLPVLFVVAESDVRDNNYANTWANVLKNNAPWTIRMATGLPHAFDAFKDNDESRKVVLETISFWKNHLDPVPQPSWQPSEGREILSYLYSDQAKGLPLLKKYTEKHPEDKRAALTLGHLLFRNKKYDEAKEVLETLLKRDNANTQALVHLAAMSYSTNKVSDAEKYVSRAMAMGKMTGEMYAQLGYELLVANMNSKSADFYEKALAIRANALDFYNLACAYAKDKHREPAIAALDKAIAMGYGTHDHVTTDPDLESIRNDERFKEIVKKIK